MHTGHKKCFLYRNLAFFLSPCRSSSMWAYVSRHIWMFTGTFVFKLLQSYLSIYMLKKKTPLQMCFWEQLSGRAHTYISTKTPCKGWIHFMETITVHTGFKCWDVTHLTPLKKSYSSDTMPWVEPGDVTSMSWARPEVRMRGLWLFS